MKKSATSKLINLSSFFLISMGLLGYIGYQLDIYVSNKVLVITAVGLLLGFALSMYETFKMVKGIENSEASNKEDGNDNKKDNEEDNNEDNNKKSSNKFF